MKIKGKKPGLAVGEVTIARQGVDNPITFRIQAIPCGFTDYVTQVFPDPVPPEKYRRTQGSNKIIKDRSGKPVTYVDRHDPLFIAAEREASRLQMVAMVAEGLKGDSQVTWETPLSLREQDPATYYQRIYHEWREFGLTEPDLARVLRAVTELSNLTAEDAEEVAESFLSEGVSPVTPLEAGNYPTTSVVEPSVTPSSEPVN